MTIHKSDAVVAGIMPDDARAGVVLCRSTEFAGGSSSYNIITGDTLQLIPIPKYAKILRIDLYHGSATQTVDADLGDGGDPDRYIASIGMSSAQVRVWPADTATCTGAAVTGFLKTYSTQDTIDLTFNTYSGSATKTFNIYCSVWYKMTGSIADET